MGSISTPLEHPFAQSAIETAASYLEGDITWEESIITQMVQSIGSILRMFQS